MKEKAVDRAIGHWPEIHEAAGIHSDFLKNAHGPCPVCGGTDRFRYDNKSDRGTFFCSGCGAGDGMKLLMNYRGCDFKEAAKFVEEFLGDMPVEAITREKRDTSAEDAAKREATKAKLQKTWDFAKVVKKGDPVWKYLTITRKLSLDRAPQVLRFHSRFPYYEGEGKDRKFVGNFPMMLAKVQGPDGKPVGLHRTYLTQDGSKAPVGKPKKLMKSLGCTGAAIRLFPCTTTLAVAEGIETALAVHEITGQPCWATISSTIMESFVPPVGVTEMTIYADNDEPDAKGRRAGQEAAAKLRERLEAIGCTVRVVQAIGAGTDIYDVLMARRETMEKRMAAKTRRVKDQAAA